MNVWPTSVLTLVSKFKVGEVAGEYLLIPWNEEKEILKKIIDFFFCEQFYFVMVIILTSWGKAKWRDLWSAHYRSNISEVKIQTPRWSNIWNFLGTDMTPQVENSTLDLM